MFKVFLENLIGSIMVFGIIAFIAIVLIGIVFLLEFLSTTFGIVTGMLIWLVIMIIAVALITTILEVKRK